MTDSERLHAAFAHIHEFGHGQGAQTQHMQAGEELTGDAEGRVFGGRGDECQVACLQERQEEVLLGPGVAMQLVQDEDFLVLDVFAQGRDADLGRADAHKGSARVTGQKQGHGGLAAARRAEEQEARQVARLHEGSQALAEVALADEIVQILGPQGFGEGMLVGHGGVYASMESRTQSRTVCASGP